MSLSSCRDRGLNRLSSAAFSGSAGCRLTMLKDPNLSAAVVVRRSTVHGQGLFAIRVITRGTVVGVYSGRRYPSGVAGDWDHGLTYLFRLSDGTIIDGSQGGNATRHINHSCEPNCTAFEVEQPGGQLQIIVEATRRIARGEELSLDYSLDVDAAEQAAFPCACGTSTCRGTMAAL